LELEGLIEILPQRGFRIRRIGTTELVEFHDLRVLLETYVVRTLCTCVDDRVLRLLGHILERQQLVADDDQSEVLLLREEFRITIARMAGLQRTARVLSSLRGVLWMVGARLVEDPNRRADVIDEHQAVLTALRRRDPDEATDAITAHIRRTGDTAMGAARDA